LAIFADLSQKNHMIFLLLNINILILYYASMQSEIDKTNLLRRSIVRFEVENNKIKAENDKIRAENLELKARIAKLEDKQTQNELIKNLLSVSQKLLNL
jgi:cell division protein FtsB